jgi:Ser/Thr protein kinase RdoA (MazF antagonist)
VRAYETLTEAGRTRRLRTLALAATARYGFATRSCACAVHSYNTIFRVEARDGARYALRVGPALRVHPAGTEAAEVAWLTALRDDGVVAVPSVLASSDGSSVLDVAVEAVPEPRRCVLFEWMSGRVMGDRITPDRARRIGIVNGLLHEHGAHWVSTPPSDIPIGDRVLYWSLPSRLGELQPAYGSLIGEALERAQRSVDDLWRDPPQPPQLLHGDLNPANVMMRGDQTIALDFQDLFWGFDQQDLAITINVLGLSPEPGPLLEAFRRGYREVRRWPETGRAQLDALIAARWIHQLNLGLNVRRKGLGGFVARHVARIRAWMDGGGTSLP